MTFNKQKKGSLTVEAVISFSIFISFMFMLLSMVKISLVKITLDNAVTETAKYIATASYPIGMFNDISEESNKTVNANVVEQKLSEDITQKGFEALFESLMAGTEAEALKAEDAGVDNVIGILQDAGTEMLSSIVYTGCERLITEQSSKVTAGILSEIIDNSHVGIDKKNLTVKIAKMPVPKQTYDAGFNTEQFTEAGLTKADFNEDDVVISVEYAYKLALPFITTIDVKMRETAVEHAWVNGGSNIPADKEGIVVEKLLSDVLGSTKVYTTNTGKKYHKKGCFYTWKSSNETTKGAAIGRGLVPCKRCSP